MKKIFVILAAIILAFGLAMGDQVYHAFYSNGASGFLRSFFQYTISPSPSNFQVKPGLPTITPTIQEPSLSFDERMKKGDYYREKGFLSFAANEYVKATELSPDNLVAYLKLTETNFELGDYNKAQADALHILELDSNHFEAQFYLMRIAIKKYEFDQALLYLDKLQLHGITDSRVDFYKALIFIAEGKHKEAREVLNGLSELSQIDTDLVKKVVLLLAAFKEFDFAQGAEDLYLGELLSRSLNEIEEYELAIYKLKTILRTRTDLRDAWNLLGFAYLNVNNYLFALSAFEQAYKLDPQLFSTQYFLGLTYSELGRKDDAIVYFNYAIQNGFEPKVLVQRKLADLYLESGDYSSSVGLYESILQSNQGDIQAFVRPIWIYLEFLNDANKALKLGETAVFNFPSNAMAYNLLGWSQFGAKNYIESEKNLKKAIEMDSTLAAAYYNLGKLYEDTDRIELAKAMYQKAYELDQNGTIGNPAAKRYNLLLLK